MKGIKRRNNKSIFRVNTHIYPKKLVELTFGMGKEFDEYLLYESDLSENEIYEKFRELLEVLV
ncbi:MAG: hypothetical protein GOU98_00320 [Candidatus Altiarchaeota archaeon]|nr:hypothetical protein [Candidatus Altiarchaeota archaeon]